MASQSSNLALNGARPTARKIGAEKEKVRRRGLGVAQLERLRLASDDMSPPGATSFNPAPVGGINGVSFPMTPSFNLATVGGNGVSFPMTSSFNPAPVGGTGATIPMTTSFNQAPVAGTGVATSGGFLPAPATYLGQETYFPTTVTVKNQHPNSNVIFPYADSCSVCQQKKMDFFEQNKMVDKGMKEKMKALFEQNLNGPAMMNNRMNSFDVRNNMIGRSGYAIYRKTPASFPDHGDMQQVFYQDGVETGLKRSSEFMVEQDLFPPSSKKCRKMDSDPYFSLSPAEMVAGGGGSCVTTTSTSTGGGGVGGGGALGGSVDASSSIDLSLRL